MSAAAPIAVLVVDDDPDQVELVARGLRRQLGEVTVETAGDGEGCLAALARRGFGIVLLDYSLPRANGLAVLAEIRRRGLDVPVVMITGQGDERVAVEAMRTGASDYLIKSTGYLTTLPTVVRRALKQHELAVENARLYDELQRRLAQTESLLAVARALGQSLDVEEIRARAAPEVARLLGAERAVVLAAEADGTVLRVAAVDPGSAAPGPVLDVRLPGGPEAAATLLHEPGGAGAGPSHPALLAVTPSPVACVYAPLTGGRGFLGGIAGYWWRPPAQPLADALAMAVGVAGQVALALDNARLYGEAQRTLGELQATQEKLVQGATLRALGEMASGASHHLNNLLAVVIGRTQLLLRAPEGTPARRSLEAIERAATDAADVVRRVLRFARAESTPERQAVELDGLAREVLEITRPRWLDEAQARGVTIEVALHPGRVGPVAGNPAALREVLMNLVFNAVDAVRDGGRIEIRTFETAGQGCVSVADSGPGMPPEVRERALQPFFTTKGPKGTGLGLSVSYGIVKSHGGELEIDSIPGHGTVVTVRLPVERPAAASTAAGPDGAGSPALRVLLVDDDEAVRAMLADLLTSRGHAVLPVASGAEALQQLERDAAVDLVLTDLGMPEMTGWELARAVRARWPELPVALVTGWGPQLEVQPEEARLVVGILAKPLRAEALQAVLAAAARRAEERRAVTPAPEAALAGTARP
jgi:signal transduction histidine kinase/FixJ family two-component response regulator